MDIFSLFLPFLEGLGIVLSPCILPILPLVLAAGVNGGKSKPYGIIIGFILMFVSFTLMSREILVSFHLKPSVLQDISFYILFLLGVIMISNTLSVKFNSLAVRLSSLGHNLSNKRSKSHQENEGGWLSGLLVGACIALIWSPCAGPIMAAVLVQVIQQNTDYKAAMMLISFSLGASVPMLLLTIWGHHFLYTKQVLLKHTDAIRKILGGVIIASVLVGKFHLWEKILIESSATEKPIEIIKNQKEEDHKALTGQKLINGLEIPYDTPKIEGIINWINSKPLDLATLAKEGKIVLIDFWTYSCINCVRTLPFIKEWYKKYADKGLVIIGVHAPEFEFEKDISNVEKAVRDFGILYPVALDSNLKTWENFQNHYWPAHYLIDKNGKVVYTHFGEGNYDQTENNIRYLLGLDHQETSNDSHEFTNQESFSISPETYLGFERTQNFQSPEDIQSTPFTYFYPPPTDFPVNSWALKGDWTIQGTYVQANKAGAKIQYHFKSAQIYLVMRSVHPDQPVSVKLYLDGQPIGLAGGKDVRDSTITINKDTLYELANFGKVREGIIEVEAEKEGLQAYAFTFGSSR